MNFNCIETEELERFADIFEKLFPDENENCIHEYKPKTNGLTAYGLWCYLKEEQTRRGTLEEAKSEFYDALEELCDDEDRLTTEEGHAVIRKYLDDNE